MNRDEVIRLARQAGVHATHTELTLMAALERFASLVAAHEREECAKVCDDFDVCDPKHIANAIRSRT